MRSLRLIALAVVACSTAALALACGGDDVAAVPDASDNDATAQDTGTNDTGTNPDTGVGSDSGATDGGIDAAPTGILCVPTDCTPRAEACCAPKGGSTDTCKAVPDGGFQRVCATNESEFRCSTSDSCGGGNSKCCARLPKFSLIDSGGPEYTATCTTQGCLSSGQSTAVVLCTPNGAIGCGDAGLTCQPLVQKDGGPGVPAGYYACQP